MRLQLLRKKEGCLVGYFRLRRNTAAATITAMTIAAAIAMYNSVAAVACGSGSGVGEEVVGDCIGDCVGVTDSVGEDDCVGVGEEVVEA